MSTTVLLLDDDQAMCELVNDALQSRGIELKWCTSSRSCGEHLQQRDYDVLVCDIELGEENGLEFAEEATVQYPELPIIVLTAFGSMKTAVRALRAGAYDFITKPVDMEALAFAIRRAADHRRLHAEVRRLREQVAVHDTVGQLVGESRPMKQVYTLIRRVAVSDSPVLITGESGTGKELVARAIHDSSSRTTQPFVALNCAAVPENLLESELFGHVRGAFTDARSDRKGLFEQANGGTIFLDEIGEMPLAMQPKLLRVLQESTVRPVGGNRDLPFDARILSATNRDLETDVDEHRFREDLFYRLNVVQIDVPPLRARGRDILVLAQHFLVRSSQKLSREIQGISSEAASKLLEYDWPGNVRQLENCIERAVTLTQHDHIMLQDLPAKIRDHEGKRFVLVENDLEHLLTMEELERRYISRVLDATKGNKTHAAKILGLDRRTLYRRLERYEDGSSSSAAPPR